MITLQMDKSLGKLLSIIGVTLLYAMPLQASPALYEQLPGHFGGFSSDGQPVTVADEFQLSQATLISNITWWGGYGNTISFPPPDFDNFTINLFDDNAGIPGSLVQTFIVGNSALRIPTGDFVNPPDFEADFEGRAEFQYSFNLPAAFPTTANTLYWLSILNVPSSDIWLWEVSSSSINLGVQRSFSDPISGPWEPYFVDNTAFQLNELNPVPEPNTLYLLTAGVIILAVLRKKKSVGVGLSGPRGGQNPWGRPC